MRRAGGGDAASGGSVFDISSLRLETTGLIGMGTGETRNSTGTGSDADTFNSPPGIEMMMGAPFAKNLANQDGREKANERVRQRKVRQRNVQAPRGALGAEVAAVRRRAPSRLPERTCVMC